MKPHDIFLDACNELTRTLTHMYKLKPNGTFGFVIRATRFKNPVIQAHYESLLAFVELRNLLVHETFGYVLAEPTEDVVRLMTHIVSKIKDPVRVKDMFIFDVISIHLEDKLSDVLKIVDDRGYTHFPVFDDNTWIGLLTDNGITHYLSHQLKEDIISIREIKIVDVFASDEHFKDVSIVHPDATLYEVIDIFDSKQHPKRAALVTRKKVIDHPSDILGIILPKDVALFIHDLI